MVGESLKISISKDLITDGINVAAAICSVPNVSKRRGSALDNYITTIISETNLEKILTSQVLQEYKNFYKKAGILGKSPAESLCEIVQRTKTLPNINKVVDCYNIVSLMTGLSIGAHDLDYIFGDIVFRYATGEEKYVSLGTENQEKINVGEYVCVDNEKVLCRMDIKQCEETKITSNTKKFLLYVQGNIAVKQNYLDESLLMVCHMIKEYCHGDYVLL